MTVSIAAPTAVLVLWWIALGLTVLVIVPLALYLLHRTWRAAHNIRRYSAEALEAAGGIAGNTALLPALDETIALAGPVLEHTGAIRELSSAAGTVLRQRAGLPAARGGSGNAGAGGAGQGPSATGGLA